MAAYCNLTTDLDYVFNRLEQYRATEILETWSSYIPGDSSYYKRDTGTITKLYQDGILMAENSSYVLLVANKGWYYDTTNELLIVIMSDNSAPSTKTITSGANWTTLKTDMRNRAQEIVDSYLNKVYVTPLSARSRQIHTTNNYEYPIVEATACITCALIIERQNPNDPNGKALMKRALNFNPDVGEKKGIINQLLDGDMVLQDQVSAREVGHWNIYPFASNTILTNPIISGIYTGGIYRIARLQIDTAGAVGTATYKVSWDGGTNWDLTLQKTRDATNEQQRMSLGFGLHIYWPIATYVLSEYWDLELFPLSDTSSGNKVSSLQVTRL